VAQVVFKNKLPKYLILRISSNSNEYMEHG